ncbi:MAG: choice-of-anchor D domain-containing protein [Solirubrobacteraceae bacterium]|nr:choice-of-anchor D domain-containing protein [Solirubrobacteraceae bacterium]
MRFRLASSAGLGLCLWFAAAAAAAAAVTPTYGGGNERTGWYGDQAGLTRSLVTGSTFGQLFRRDLAVGDQVDAQPVVVGGTLIVATEQNRVYGLDPETGAERWSLGPDTLGTAVATADSTRETAGDSGCDVPRGTTGVTGTPVGDPATDTVYFFAKRYATKPDPTDPSRRVDDPTQVRYVAHAVDAATGTERPGFPVTLEGFAADNAPGVHFQSRWELQRPGLLLLDGGVYAAFAGHCDRGPYQGWVVGIGTNGTVRARWSAVPSGAGAGIWQSGGGLVSDGPGRVLFLTGNAQSPTGVIPGTSPPGGLGQSVVRLGVGTDGRLSARDFFTPYDAPLLDPQDVDFGSGGPVALPDDHFGTPAHPHLMVAVGKQGIVYLLDRDDLGGVRTGVGRGNRVLQEAGPIGGVWSRPAVWPGDGGWVWVNTASGGGIVGGGSEGRLEVLGYGVDPSGNPLLSAEGASTDQFSLDSGTPVVTSDGTRAGSGLLWVVWAPWEGFGAQLRVYDAVPRGGRPVLLRSWPIGRSGKFQPPGVAAGRIYVAARGCASAREPSRCPTSTRAAIVGFGAPVQQPLTAGSLAFPGTQVGSDVTRTATLTATRTVEVRSVSSGDPRFVASPPTLPITLTRGQTLDVPVRFAPDGVETFASQLTVSTSEGDVSTGLSGRGLSPAPVLRPITPVSFGGALIGGPPLRQAISLWNDGVADLHVQSVHTPGAPFAIDTDVSAPFTIAADHSALLQLRFQPNATGLFADEIVIESDGGTRTIVLSGTASNAPVMETSPMRLDAGDVELGSSRELTFTVRNAGGAAAVISRSQPPGLGAFVALDALAEGTTLAPGASRTIRLQFSPTTAGPTQDSWSLNANDAGGRREVVFTGTGIAPPQPPFEGQGNDYPPGPGPVIELPKDTLAPAIRGLRIRGRTLVLTVSEPSRIKTVLSRRKGRRLVPLPAIRTTAPRAGTVRIRLPRSLRPGRYVARVTARDPTDNVSTAAKVSLTVR